MPSIYREATIDAPVGDVWPALADVGAIDRLIDFLGKVELDGNRRTCTMPDGGQLEETIITIDDERRRVVYTITQSPFGFEHHSAAMEAVEDDGRTRFVWTTDFLPAAAEGPLTEAVDHALASMTRALASTPA